MDRPSRSSPRRRRLRRGIALPVAALLLGSIAVIAPTTASASSSATAQGSLQLDAVRESVDYLVREYGVSTQEALRRLELQRQAPGLDQQLAASFPDSYGGMWLDQEKGGTLVVNATKPDQIAAALSTLPQRSHIRVAAVRYSRRALQADAERIARVYGDIATVDEVNNVVVVHPPAAKALRDAAAHPRGAGRAVPGSLAAMPVDVTGLGAALEAALAPLTATGRVRVDRAALPATYDNCTLSGCSPPMRGGAKLSLYDSLSGSYQGYCTNGFNLGSSNGWQWTITAGHCLDNSNENYTKHNGYWVGRWDLYTFIGSSYPWDGAITPYVVTGGVNYAEYWLSGQPKNRVWAVNKSNSLFPIYGSYTYDQIGVGWVTCLTGAGINTTRCGKVVGKDGGIITDICAAHGDSGGPIYSQIDNRAYAIHNKDTTSDNSCPSGYRSYNSALSKLMSAASNTSGYAFWVNTA